MSVVLDDQFLDCVFSEQAQVPAANKTSGSMRDCSSFFEKPFCLLFENSMIFLLALFVMTVDLDNQSLDCVFSEQAQIPAAKKTSRSMMDSPSFLRNRLKII